MTPISFILTFCGLRLAPLLRPCLRAVLLLAVRGGVEAAVHVGDGAEVLQEERAGQVVVVVLVVDDLGRGRTQVGHPAGRGTRNVTVFGNNDSIVLFISFNLYGRYEIALELGKAEGTMGSLRVLANQLAMADESKNGRL